MALVSLEGRWLQVNRSLCRIIGYDERELLTRDFQSITFPEDLNADLAYVRQLIAGEILDYHMVKRYFHKRGHLVWVLLNVSLLRSADGTPLYFISQIQDITEQKHAEWLDQDRRRVLEMVASDTPLPSVLNQLAGAVERQVERSIAAFIIVQAGELLLYAPHLQEDWRRVLQAGPLSRAAALSNGAWSADDGCGVSYLQSDPVWQDLRESAAGASAPVSAGRCAFSPPTDFRLDCS